MGKKKNLRKDNPDGLGQATGSGVNPGTSITWGAIYPSSALWPGAAAGTGAAEDPGVELPTREQEEPIKGFKLANVRFSSGRYMFLALRGHSSYGIEGTASCERVSLSGFGTTAFGEPHAAPAVGCRCGFYAVPEPGDLYNTDYEYLAAPFLLELDLFGRVVVHEKGYRAEKQRVLSVKTQRRCYYCAANASLLALMGDSVCPMCDRHADPHVWITLADLGSILQTEVTWA